MLDPVAGFSPVVQHEADFDVQYWLPRGQNALELRLNHFGKIAQRLADGLSQVLRGRDAIHLGQSVVNHEITEIGVQNAKTHFRRAEIGT